MLQLQHAHIQVAYLGCGARACPDCVRVFGQRPFPASGSPWSGRCRCIPDGFVPRHADAPGYADAVGHQTGRARCRSCEPFKWQYPDSLCLCRCIAPARLAPRIAFGYPVLAPGTGRQRIRRTFPCADAFGNTGCDSFARADDRGYARAGPPARVGSRVIVADGRRLRIRCGERLIGGRRRRPWGWTSDFGSVPEQAFQSRCPA